MKIEKSQEALKREKKIADLEQQIKRTQTTLKSLKTRLANTQTRIEEIQREFFRKTERIKNKWLEVTRQITQLTEKLRNDQRLLQDERALIEGLYQALVLEGQEAMPPLDSPDIDYSQTEDKARFQDLFESFKIEPDSSDQREIRKIYLGLSKRFHPDRARNDNEKKQYHELQQQINDAYQTHDIQALLDLERFFAEPESPVKGVSTIDLLDAQITGLKNQLQALKQQQKRLSKEIKQLRNSDLGNMLTMVDGMERYGASMDEGLGLSMMEDMVGLLERLKSALESTQKEGKISPDLIEIQTELNSPSPFDLYDEFFEDDLYGDGMAPYFWDDEFSEFEENPNPKFPVGTPVRIDRKFEIYYIDDKDIKYTFDGKGLSGVISDTLLDGDGLPFYYVQLDIPSMNRLPGDYVRLHTDMFSSLEVEDEKVLGHAKKYKKDSPEKVFGAYREILYQHLFHYLPVDQKKRLRQILLAFPGQTDEVNWLACFEEQLPLPFTARVKEVSQYPKPGQKVKVIQYGGYSDEVRIQVLIQAGQNRVQLLPLAELEGIGSSPVGQLLDDYLAWFELMM